MGLSNEETTEKILNGYRMPCPKGCPQELHEIMLKCWKQDPQERPTFKQIFDWLSMIKMNSIKIVEIPSIELHNSSTLSQIESFGLVNM